MSQKIIVLSLACLMLLTGFAYSDESSKELTAKAWSSLLTEKYSEAISIADKCTKTFGDEAVKQQASLTDFPSSDNAAQYWALNDVAICEYIKGRALKEMGEKEKARTVFRSIIKDFPHSQCWDPKGWFWKVAESAQDQILFMDSGIDFDDYTSEKLAIKAWQSLGTGDYASSIIYADKCISLYEKLAKHQQESLSSYAPHSKAFDYAALNDVATAYFIKGRALKRMGKNNEAADAFNTISQNYRFAQCWDPKGWFWKVAPAAMDEMSGAEFGNMSSEVLVAKAWESLTDGRHDLVEKYVSKCLEMYGEKGKGMQKSLSDFAPDKEAFNYWALNDVATCLFIKGKSLQLQNKEAEAKKYFHAIIDDYTYAQAWDPQGWFWRVSVAASDQIMFIDTGIDFGDYTSESLTVKAWESLSNGHYDACLVYTRKCINLYKKLAEEQQGMLSGYAPKEKAFDYGVLNDVGTCYYIMGEAYSKKGEAKKALDAYNNLVSGYYYSQCWDPHGWFWKPAVSARGKINKIAAEKGMLY